MKYMTVANVDIAIIEYKGQRTLTTEQVSEVYECEPIQIQQNYANNKDRFEEGKHYFKLEGEELKQFKASITDSKFSSQLNHVRALMLWTKQGASRHCKMLGTDKAWDMFDCLEENYFNPKQQEMYIPQNYPDALRAYADAWEQKQLAESKVKELQPKADFYDATANSETLFSMADVAKTLDMGIGRNKLFKFLRDKEVLQSDNMPYQKFVDAGYFKVIEGKYMAGDNVVISKTTYVKQKGIDYIRKLLIARE